jgi:hypothetical protein
VNDAVRFPLCLVVEELDEVNWAVDGGPLISPLQGLSEVATPGGEFFVLFEPQPLDAVRDATIDLVRAGMVVLHRESPSKVREFTADEAVMLLAEESTWTGDEYYELSATEAGRDAYVALHARHGGAFDKAHAESERRYEEFLERHPSDEQRRAEWLETLGRWVETGRGAPTPPRYEDEPPPYEGDVPRYVKPPRTGERQRKTR